MAKKIICSNKKLRTIVDKKHTEICRKGKLDAEEVVVSALSDLGGESVCFDWRDDKNPLIDYLKSVIIELGGEVIDLSPEGATFQDLWVFKRKISEDQLKEVLERRSH